MAEQRPEMRAPITSEAIANSGFRTSLRGFDVNQVREFLRAVAEHVRALQAHNDDLHRRLREAEGRAEHPVLDDAQLAAVLGEEMARVLQSAHEAAAEIRGRAEEHVERVVQQARDDSAKLTVDASSVFERRRAEAETQAVEILRQARDEAARLSSEAQAAAAAAVAEAQQAAGAAIEHAKAERNEVLSDVRRRRRVANTQIEQLRAGRERLLEAYALVRSTLEQVTAELHVADDEARKAANEVGRRMEAALDPNRADALASAPPIDIPAPAPAPVVVDEPAPEPTPEPVAQVESRPHRKGRRGARPPAPTPPVVAAEPAPEPEPEPEEAAASPDANVAAERVAARHEVIVALEEHLTRRLKRALQDEQNLVLDRLRSVRGNLSAAAALGAEAAHLASYSQIVEPALNDAARAGAAATGTPKGVAASLVGAVANDLAMELILPLRRRIDERLHEAAAVGDDQITASDRVSSAYRELKAQRVGRLAEDWLAAAWAVGVHAATPRGELGTWASAPDQPCCTDCDDNGLAGAVAVGTPFPTGHLHPPAHPGCRCVVVPTT